jgi:phosphoribosyl 1,2-cyclic phosphodiesterase
VALRFCSLGSGSSGNATLIEARDGLATTRLLVDCGFSLKQLEARLHRIGLSAAELDAVFVTHEHGDHIGCALPLARRHGVAVWMSQGTWQAIGEPDPGDWLRFARDGEPVAVGAVELRPYTVPHDAREPLQLTASDGQVTLGVLTDAGSSTSHLLQALRGVHGLMLECNHDRERLAASSYPAMLKARIAGKHGHLANDTSAQILAALLHDGLRHVVAAHLSEQNNTPELAREALGQVLGSRDIVVANQRLGFDWLDLN